MPQFNNILSRTEPDVSSWITKNTTIGMPIIPANMDTVISVDLAKVIVANGGYPIFHRFCPLTEQLEFVNTLAALLWCKYSEQVPQYLTATELSTGKFSFKVGTR